MIDLITSCIISRSADDLNTQMVVKLDGQEFRVAICDKCEDEASPKVIKEKLRERLRILKGLCNEANVLLGTNLTLDSLYALGVQTSNACQPPPVAAQPPPVVQPVGHAGAPPRRAGRQPVISNKPISRDRASMPSRAAQARAPDMPSQRPAQGPKAAGGTASIDIPGMTDGRLVKEDQTGHTEIRIMENVNPIASRSGAMLETSHRDPHWCPQCLGEGIIQHGGQTSECRACGGSGILLPNH